MNQWLRSNEIAALTDQPDWPTPETAEIWKQFRNEALAGRVQKWFSQDWQMDCVVGADVDPAVSGRIGVDAITSEVSVTTADYQHVVGIRHRLRQFAPSLLHVDFAVDRKSARIERLGRGEARWELPA